MRSTIVAAAFAAGALAVPWQKRATITDYDIVYVTEVVTVTAGAAQATHSSSHYGHSIAPSSSSHALPPVSSSKAPIVRKSSTSQAAAPASTSKSSTHAAAPVSTSKSSSVAPPPPHTSSSVAPTTHSTTAPTTHSTAAASSTKASSTKASSTSAAAAAPTSYQEIVVFHHNLHRANHSAPAIVWDAGLASTAQTIASSCVYEHNVGVNGGGYGQNIAAGVQANNVSAIITDLFYNGEEEWFANLYGQAQPDMTNFEHWGHFSQIVWKASTKVGCATQYCPNGLQYVAPDVAPYFTVCNYENPGNYANEYGSNIGSPLGHATAQWNTGL